MPSRLSRDAERDIRYRYKKPLWVAGVSSRSPYPPSPYPRAPSLANPVKSNPVKSNPATRPCREARRRAFARLGAARRGEAAISTSWSSQTLKPAGGPPSTCTGQPRASRNCTRPRAAARTGCPSENGPRALAVASAGPSAKTRAPPRPPGGTIARGSGPPQR